MKKTRQVRTVRLTPGIDTYGNPYTRASIRLAARRLDHAVGKQLGALYATKIVFLDKMPRRLSGYLMVIGTPKGILLVLQPRFYSEQPVAEEVPMCLPFRRRLVGGIGDVRWARVVI